MAARMSFAALICVMALALAQLAVAQVNPNPLSKNDPNYVQVDIELLKKVQAGDTGLRKRYVAYYINDFGCAANPDRAMNVMTRLYAWRAHSEAGVLETVSKIMDDAKTTIDNAPPSKKKCEEWKTLQDTADKAAEARVKILQQQQQQQQMRGGSDLQPWQMQQQQQQPRQQQQQQQGGGGSNSLVARVVSEVVDGILGR